MGFIKGPGFVVGYIYSSQFIVIKMDNFGAGIIIFFQPGIFHAIRIGFNFIFNGLNKLIIGIEIAGIIHNFPFKIRMLF